MNSLPDWWPHPKPYAIMDCLEGMKALPDKCVDLVLTDPPYGISQDCNLTKSGTKNYGTVFFGDWDDTFPIEILSELIRICKGSFYIFSPHQMLGELDNWAVKNNLQKRVLWWIKANPTRRNGDVYWSIPGEHIFFAKFSKATFNSKYEIGAHTYPIQGEGLHPCEKPWELCQKYIEASTNKGDIVLDPFLGSGTTLRACRETGRVGLGFEIEKDYEFIIKKRMMEEIPKLEEWF